MSAGMYARLSDDILNNMFHTLIPIMSLLFKFISGLDSTSKDTVGMNPEIVKHFKQHIVPWDARFREWVQSALATGKREELFEPYLLDERLGCERTAPLLLMHGWDKFQSLQNRGRVLFPSQHLTFAILMEQYKLQTGGCADARVMSALSWSHEGAYEIRMAALKWPQHWILFEKRCIKSDTSLETFNAFVRVIEFKIRMDRDSNTVKIIWGHQFCRA
eukprot:3941560-Rhodomonas_salina.1